MEYEQNYTAAVLKINPTARITQINFVMNYIY